MLSAQSWKYWCSAVQKCRRVDLNKPYIRYQQLGNSVQCFVVDIVHWTYFVENAIYGGKVVRDLNPFGIISIVQRRKGLYFTNSWLNLVNIFTWNSVRNDFTLRIFMWFWFNIFFNSPFMNFMFLSKHKNRSFWSETVMYIVRYGSTWLLFSVFDQLWFMRFLKEILMIWPECDNLCKKDSKDQESIQSSTTPVPGYQMGK